MIRHLSGVLQDIRDNELLVTVGGVGLLVFVSTHTTARFEVGEKANLWTHLAVRENALDLYGFDTREELHFFELLLTISGIGPKSALGILSIASLDELKVAIRENNPGYLTKVSGVGKKSAEKIVLELRDKVEIVEDSSGTGLTNTETDALDALESLGYPRHIAREALRTVPKEITETQGKIKEALKKLGS